ncbi:hypothetical protein [Latilactobacillus sakei]|uniref:hypothetical protein n=1 Tax=Latilactobacillus sakei TaxID=1599 RepID=UPI002073FDCF|nr:hypothetical protein [Latilactobacillus sakei]
MQQIVVRLQVEKITDIKKLLTELDQSEVNEISRIEIDVVPEPNNYRRLDNEL